MKYTLALCLGLGVCMAAQGQGKIEILNVENPVVHRFMEESATELEGSASSWTREQFVVDGDYRPDQPNTKVVALVKSRKSSWIEMATDEKFQHQVLRQNVTGQDSYRLRNFVPGNTYYYRQVNKKGRVMMSGALQITGQVRMIHLDNGFNIRDLGGWLGLDNRRVRYEKIYRGGSLGGTDMKGDSVSVEDQDRYAPSSADREELHRLGIRAQLDLRAATNGGKYGGEHSHHSYARGYITMHDADYNNTMTDYGAYGEDESVVCDIAWIILELRRGRPVYFNCRQGADRTGTIAFVIEGLLGCYGGDGAQMAKDYELTCFSQADLIDNKKADCYRIAKDIYGGKSKLFSKLLHQSRRAATLQENCYHYLTAQWPDCQIPREDVDWFINYMLGVTDNLGTPSAELKRVAELKSNIVRYAE